MKKLTAILIALLVTASAMAGCAKDKPVAENDVQVETGAPSNEEVNEETPAEDEIEQEEAPAEGEEAPEVEAIEPEPEEETPAEDEVIETPEEGETEEVPSEDEIETPATEEVTEEDESTADEPVADVADTSTADGIIEAINAIKAPEFMHGIIPVDIADPDALKMFTGLDSAEGIKEVAVCESLMGSQAFSLVVVKVDGADAKATAEAMKAGIDQRKWICVEADDIKVSGKGDTVMLIMIDSEYRESISVEDVTEAFKTVCGGSLDFEI